jgi:retron-type reverse transcriptase
LLSTISKLLERIIHDQLYEFLERNNINGAQYGFRKGEATQEAVNELVNYALDGINDKQKVGVIFLNIRKAFDTVNHNLLLR